MKSDILALERTQVSVARSIIRESRKSMSNIAVLRTIGWPTLAWRRRRQKLLCLWLVLRGEGPLAFAKVCLLLYLLDLTTPFVIPNLWPFLFV